MSMLGFSARFMTRASYGLAMRQSAPAAWTAANSFAGARWMAGAAGKPSPSEITTRVVDVVKAFEKVDSNKVDDKAHFKNDLGLDSLDAVELVMAMEDEFCIEIPDEAADNIISVPDAVSYLVANPHIK